MAERMMRLAETRIRPARATARDLPTIAAAGGGGPPGPRRGGPGRRGRPPLATTQLRQMTGTEPIPVRSAARGGGDQEMFLEDGPIGYTPRPSNLNGVRGAYAIYMIGDSMEPRYQQGWLLHVNPFKPAIRGRDVVVYKKDKAALIKQFAGWEKDALLLRQLNPAREIKVPREEVAEIHLVVGV